MNFVVYLFFVSDSYPWNQMKTIVLLISLVLFSDGAFVQAQVAATHEGRTVAGDTTTARQPTKKKSKSPKGAMLRSLALPGWGQAYNGQWIKTVIVLAAHGALIGYAIYYDNQATKFRAQPAQQEFYQDKRNLMFWLLGATKLLSMLDAYIDAHLYDFDAGPDLALRLGALQTDLGASSRPIMLGFSLRAKF